MPALITRVALCGNPVCTARLSPNGRYVAFLALEARRARPATEAA